MPTIKLHYITLNYITLHWITLHYITIHTYIHTHIYIYTYIYINIYIYDSPPARWGSLDLNKGATPHLLFLYSLRFSSPLVLSLSFFFSSASSSCLSAVPEASARSSSPAPAQSGHAWLRTLPRALDAAGHAWARTETRKKVRIAARKNARLNARRYVK